MVHHYFRVEVALLQPTLVVALNGVPAGTWIRYGTRFRRELRDIDPAPRLKSRVSFGGASTSPNKEARVRLNLIFEDILFVDTL